MKKYFIDSNIIIYANDCRDPMKQQRALDVIAEHMIAGSGVISTQVLQEYAQVALNPRSDIDIRHLPQPFD